MSGRDTAAGQWVQAGVCYRAYVPAPLPLTVALDDALSAALRQAEHALQGLAAESPSDSRVEACLRREALASAALDVPTPGDPRVEVIADTIVGATHYAVERMQQLPLSLRLLCEVHAELMRGQTGGGGEFRRHQTWVGPAGSAPATADYVPVPPGRLPVLLDDWERYLHAVDATHDFVRLALLHAQFHHLQPFAQGSERLNRLLIPLVLRDRGWPAAPLLGVSAAIAAQRGAYAERLRAVRDSADWSGWLRFFLHLLTHAATAETVSSDTPPPASP
jgi:Fic family protein